MNPEEQDWIDRAISRDGMWEPPARYVERLAARAMAVHAVPSRRRTSVLNVFQSIRLRLEGSVWVVRQYRDLLFS
jgi:hypothetical protein